MKVKLMLLALAATCLCGCQTYVYRIAQPQTGAPVVGDQPVTVHVDPLDYTFRREESRLSMQINNPTADRILLRADRSYVVDPQGESHPVRARIIAPHSFSRMLLPPLRLTLAYPEYGWGAWSGYAGWGWGWGPYIPYWGPYYGPAFWGPPPVSYQQVVTSYDWVWNTGGVQLHLSYERGNQQFEHAFEIVREPKK